MILSYENIQDATYILGILPWYMYLSSAYAILTYICCRVYDVFSNSICRFDAYNTLISKLNLYFTR